MSDPSEQPWSNHPNAPQITSLLYLMEKELFAGMFIGAISYDRLISPGIVVVLFLRCMAVLFSPANSIRKGIKWVFVVHAVVLFSVLTIPVGIHLNDSSAIYINIREFPGNSEWPPGPYGSLCTINSKATTLIFTAMFPLNQWLADGLLLHRCYIICSMNRRVMAFPCLVYLTSVVTGVMLVYQNSLGFGTVTAFNFTTSYYSISLSLNVLLTLMIVTRLILHIRYLRKATGASGGSSGLHTATATVVTILIESYALHAVALPLYIVPWAVDSPVVNISSGIGGATQVIAPYLIILRVANRKALTSDSISGTSESIRFRSEGSMDGDGSIPDGDPVNAMEVNGEAPGELGTGDENAIEEVSL